MNNYSFRAECIGDAKFFLQKINVSFWNVTDDQDFPDVNVSFDSKLTLQQIRKILVKLLDKHDIHVIIESLNFTDRFNGDRYFLSY